MEIAGAWREARAVVPGGLALPPARPGQRRAVGGLHDLRPACLDGRPGLAVLAAGPLGRRR